MGMHVPCFGRDREVDLLEGLWEESCDEPAARVMLMICAAGGGKSRVRHEFCDRIQRRGRPLLSYFVGRGDPCAKLRPLPCWDPRLLARRWHHRRRARASAAQAPDRARRALPTGQGRSATAAFLGEWPTCPFLLDEDLLPCAQARQDPRLMADQMLMSWLEWLEAECDHHPVLLVLEDLHWGDTPA